MDAVPGPGEIRGRALTRTLTPTLTHAVTVMLAGEGLPSGKEGCCCTQQSGAYPELALTLPMTLTLDFTVPWPKAPGLSLLVCGAGQDEFNGEYRPVLRDDLPPGRNATMILTPALAPP